MTFDMENPSPEANDVEEESKEIELNEEEEMSHIETELKLLIDTYTEVTKFTHAKFGAILGSLRRLDRLLKGQCARKRSKSQKILKKTPQELNQQYILENFRGLDKPTLDQMHFYAKKGNAYKFAVEIAKFSKLSLSDQPKHWPAHKVAEAQALMSEIVYGNYGAHVAYQIQSMKKILQAAAKAYKNKNKK